MRIRIVRNHDGDDKTVKPSLPLPGLPERKLPPAAPRRVPMPPTPMRPTRQPRRIPGKGGR
ncbi:hypothetical protein [Streptosporangium carneum]|uniref:Uncharacterized protein n=1 Tax=Streptosporangium carneum TaxID=47481 RepID=A0A9W6MH46_9ACTN|nr:hypothetical protein [Streptosporangium carneum]GLK13797.1 hypothetical protein GCM10017600_72080 [Streptosporangium carneum]